MFSTHFSNFALLTGPARKLLLEELVLNSLSTKLNNRLVKLELSYLTSIKSYLTEGSMAQKQSVSFGPTNQERTSSVAKQG